MKKTKKKNKIHIVHASDHHGALRQLPIGDLYVISGDMLPDFGSWRNIDSQRFVTGQTEWLKDKNLSDYIPNKDAPIILVRGNHDFIDYAYAFKDHKVYDIQNPAVVFNIKGLRIGGCRGVAYIGLGWSDELTEDKFNDVVSELPTDLDIMVTHAPPHGILDEVNSYGSRSLLYYLQKCSIIGKVPKLWCFGHCHYDSGKKYFGNTLMSNAATTINEFDLAY